MAKHSFDVTIAQRYGVNSAVLLDNLYFWIEKNKANNKHFYDGYYWTYNSKKAFAELFPYMNARQVDYALKKLVDDGVVITGNYNQNAYDRTLWYAITKKGYCILQNCDMDETKMQNGCNENVEPIPYNKPVEKQADNKPSKERKKESTYDALISDFTSNDELTASLIDFIKMRKMMKKPLTDRALQLALNKLAKLATDEATQIEIVNQSIERNWLAFFPLKDDSNNGYKKTSNQSYGEKLVTINGEQYIEKNGKYYVPNGSGIAVDPYKKDDLPF